MANIRPFHGVRYQPEKVDDLSLVVSQPHDRVRHGLQDKYYDLSPYNVARLIKGKRYPDDDETNNVFTRSRDAYAQWREEGVLVEESVPAFYAMRQTFTLPDGTVKTRTGLTAALELTEFDEGIVLPHERTLSQSLSERLELLRSTSVNFGSVFMLYPGAQINELIDQAISRRDPDVEVRELLYEKDVIQQMWAITDPDTIEAIVEAMAPKRNLIIADGHHRYETALQYRDEMRARYPDAPENAAFNYRLVNLVSMDDPGLEILPTHRLIHSYGRMSGSQMLERAAEYFDVHEVEDKVEIERLLAEMGTQCGCIGFHNGKSAVLRLRDKKVMEHLLPERPHDWRMLDVSVLHELFIERVLDIDKEAVANHECIDFVRNPRRGYREVDEGRADVMLVLNPTRIDQVRACSVAGERMPQKSTDFYPKVISGLVMFPVGPEDRV